MTTSPLTFASGEVQRNVLDLLDNWQRRKLIDIVVNLKRPAEDANKVFAVIRWLRREEFGESASPPQQNELSTLSFWLACRKAYLAKSQFNDKRMPDDPVDAAHMILETIPGAAEKPFMLLQAAEMTSGEKYASCNCYYHTVVYMNDAALVYTRDEGGMVPWVETTDGDGMPDFAYFDRIVKLPKGTGAALINMTARQIEERRLQWKSRVANGGVEVSIWDSEEQESAAQIEFDCYDFSNTDLGEALLVDRKREEPWRKVAERHYVLDIGMDYPDEFTDGEHDAAFHVLFGEQGEAQEVYVIDEEGYVIGSRSNALKLAERVEWKASLGAMRM